MKYTSSRKTTRQVSPRSMKAINAHNFTRHKMFNTAKILCSWSAITQIKYLQLCCPFSSTALSTTSTLTWVFTTQLYFPSRSTAVSTTSTLTWVFSTDLCFPSHSTAFNACGQHSMTLPSCQPSSVGIFEESCKCSGPTPSPISNYPPRLTKRAWRSPSCKDNGNKLGKPCQEINQTALHRTTDDRRKRWSQKNAWCAKVGERPSSRAWLTPGEPLRYWPQTEKDGDSLLSLLLCVSLHNVQHMRDLYKLLFTWHGTAWHWSVTLMSWQRVSVMILSRFFRQCFLLARLVLSLCSAKCRSVVLSLSLAGQRWWVLLIEGISMYRHRC